MIDPRWAALGAREFRLDPPFEIGREAVRDFARAVLETDPVHHDVSAARAAGHPDLIAPATYLSTLALRFALPARRSPDLGLDLTRMVHGGQRFAARRPLYAGDVLGAVTRFVQLRPAGPHVRVETETEVWDERDGTPVGTAGHVCVVLGGAA